MGEIIVKLFSSHSLFPPANMCAPTTITHNHHIRRFRPPLHCGLFLSDKTFDHHFLFCPHKTASNVFQQCPLIKCREEYQELGVYVCKKYTLVLAHRDAVGHW